VQILAMFKVDPATTEVPLLHRYLLSAVAPRPIALASTISKDGIANVAPFSFFNVFSANPPIAVFSPAKSGRTGQNKDTFINAKETGEVVINVVNYDIVAQTSLASSPYPPEESEFVKAGFTPLASEKVKPFRVAESPIHLECTVENIIELGEQGGAGNLIICRIVLIHIRESILDANNMIDQTKVDFVARMGGNWYNRTIPQSMFEIDKPLTTRGIGFDQLPDEIRHSSILTGNDLGLLANVETLPDETDVNEWKLTELADLFITLQDDPKTLEIKLHEMARDQIRNRDVLSAWKTLLSFNN
jgi:flavin reductase (DIM6/NTAB) family NADH-FMN oxidoreductase RutF